MNGTLLQSSQFDVLIVGAGCAGLSAAIGLAKAGARTCVVEAAVYPGAENWSGCVYFCESLAHPELLGPEGVEALAWERRLVQRGAYLCNGQSLLGLSYRDPKAFRRCYTVLRPVFDHHLGVLAEKHGVVLLTQTTAESLLRDEGRVVGVATNRGPLYADLTFLAEGDASHLVSREGYERLPAGQKQPKFLHGVKQLIDLPPEAIERNFGLRPGEGAACEIILRNATLHGKKLKLNMGGFIYTNRASLSIGLVLPADHLHEHFAGDPNLLIEWFENLPDLQPWLKDGTRGVFGAKLIRGGGPREFPQMTDDGLAVGGAASGVGVDFPYPNYTGPATRMGLELTRAYRKIKQAGGRFTAQELNQQYLMPLRQTRAWRDAEFLRDWPGYVESTKVFFDRQVDLLLGAAHVATAKSDGESATWRRLVDLVLAQTAGDQLDELKQDQKLLRKAMPVPQAFAPPPLPILLVDGWLNLLRGWFRQPPSAAPTGEASLHYTKLGDSAGIEPPPAVLQEIFRRMKPGLAEAARAVYENDDTPLPKKLNHALRSVFRQVHLGSLLVAGLAAAKQGWRLRGLLRGKKTPAPVLDEPTRRLLAAATPTPDLTPLVAQAAQKWEDRLGRLGYLPAPQSHIHLRWPTTLEAPQKVAEAGLWHVCPAHVYEARVSPLGQLQVVVNYENCIKCETCWRTSDLVDWARDGGHRFIYSVQSPAVAQTLKAQEADPVRPPASPYRTHAWEFNLDERADAQPSASQNGAAEKSWTAPLLSEARRLDAKLSEFAAALAAEPRTIDTPRADYLTMLARYAQSLGRALDEGARQASATAASSAKPIVDRLLQLSGALLPQLAKLVLEAEAGRFGWAAAEGRRLQQHGLAGMLTLLHAGAPPSMRPSPAPEPHLDFLATEEDLTNLAAERAALRERLDDVWGPYLWRDLEHGEPLTPAQEAALREAASRVPPLERNRLAETLHPPRRKLLLAEAARRDAALGFRIASHLWARDLAALFAPSWPSLSAWNEANRWVAFAHLEGGKAEADLLQGEALFVPAADEYVVLVDDRLCRFAADELKERLEPLATLGLRGAGLLRLKLSGLPLPADAATVDGAAARLAVRTLQSADLVALAEGMAELWTERCVAHAANRVQFPGLFHDERSRDAIGKFGAVKKMLAEMGAARLMIETLSHVLSPEDFSSASAERAGLVKAVVGELLGTAPGSLGYNAGQVFGGTGYSEDDILSKAYRDAAAWRFLGGPNPELFRAHGKSLKAPTAVRGEAEEFALLRRRGGLSPMLERIEALQAKALPRERDDGEAAEARGRLDAFLFASKALLLRLHRRLEAGLGSEAEEALAQVWFGQLRRWADEWTAKGNAEPPAALQIPGYAPETDYRRFMQSPIKALPAGVKADDPAVKKALGYSTGDFLTAPLDLRLPRYVPELIEIDATLKAADERFHALIAQQFGAPREGQRFERWIEAQHLPGDADLDFCRAHGFFAMPIPAPLGGQGKLKAEYYSLVMQLNQFADATMSLLVQANTSIGTSPILLARDKDLPKAVKEIKPFVHDEELHAKVGLLCAALASRIGGDDAAGAQATLKELEPKIEPLLKSGTLRNELKAMADAWKIVSRAVAVGDLKKAKPKAGGLKAAWDQAAAAAKDLYAELNLRLKACDLGLRWIASGQISAFALTEPSAGSDTARVASRAVLRSVPVEEDADGVLCFTPAGAAEPRFLLDAERLEFKPEGPSYRFRDDAPPAPIRFDDYDYATDDPRRTRYYLHGLRRVNFTDIAYLRSRDGRRWYDYWELTGAKMWITNGRMSGIMALYAKTPQGVTGFIVDRHAEGLIVGKDEAKMGQNGSPTNELALQAVRVPRENVLGLEGRGQVNALETLNVGRAGLAMSSVSQMRTLPEIAAAAPPEAAGWRLDRIREETFLAEALAFHVIGLFEHPSMQSVRIESAAAKALVSELLHSSIERTEEILGLAGQTRLHLVEKRKRDARIINLYEGTNEIQRFLLIKEMAAEALPHWQASTPALSGDQLSQKLAASLEQFRVRLTFAGRQFGGGLWQNPNLQPTVFLLSEGAMWILAAQAAAGRLLWLANRSPAADLTLGLRAFDRCLAELERRLNWFDDEWAGVLAGRYAPVIRAADLMLDEAAHAASAADSAASQIEGPLSIVVLLEPTGAAVPQPHVQGGKLLEPWRSLTPADQAALELALRLRDSAPEKVRLAAFAVGGRALEPLLREVAALGVETHLLQPPTDSVAPSDAAAALAKTLSGRAFDLLLGPAHGADQGEGLLAPLVAAELGLPYHGPAGGLGVRFGPSERTLRMRTEGGSVRLRGLPAAASILPGLPLRPFTTAGFLEGLAQPTRLLPWPEGAAAAALQWSSQQGVQKPAEAKAEPTKLDASAAAGLLLEELGLHAGAAVPKSAVPLQFEEAAGPCRIDAARTLAVVACDAEGRLGSGAISALRIGGPNVLLLAPADHAAQEKAAQALAEAGASQIDILAHAQLAEGDELRARALMEAWPTLMPLPKHIVGERWTELAFPSLRRRAGSTGALALRIKRLSRRADLVSLESSLGQGKLMAGQTLDLKQAASHWLTLTDDAEVAEEPLFERPDRCVVRRWPDALERVFGQPDFARLLEELKDAAGVARLADAEFILDVGYGVGNRDGYEAVVEPLEASLRALGVRNLMIGGSRKVTEELHLLPADRQIGQSGVSVNPRILLALGISGAPQHLQYIGSRAVILCFNKDAEAPMMTLNQRQPRPKVFPIVGDLFKTVPTFIQALGAEERSAAGVKAGEAAAAR